MKILCFSDVHVRCTGTITKWETPTYSNIMRHIYESSHWLHDRIIEIQPDLVVDCGDHLHNPSNVDPLTLRTSVDFVNTVASACKTVRAEYVTLVGNHDTIYPAQHTLSHMTQTQLVNKALAKYENLAVFIGNHRKVEDFLATLKQTVTDKTKFVFIHQDVAGMRMNSWLVNHSGIKVETLPENVKIYGGHYHHPQVLKNIRIIGGLLHHNFTDDPGTHRGILVIDTATGIEEEIENPFSPKYVKLEFLEGQEVQSNPYKSLAYASHNIDHSRNYYAIKVGSEVKETQEWLDAKKKLQEQSLGIKVSVVKKRVDIASGVGDHTTKPETVLKKVIDGFDTTLNKEELFKTGLTFLGA